MDHELPQIDEEHVGQVEDQEARGLDYDDYRYEYGDITTTFPPTTIGDGECPGCTVKENFIEAETHLHGNDIYYPSDILDQLAAAGVDISDFKEILTHHGTVRYNQFGGTGVFYRMRNLSNCIFFN